MKRMLLVWIGVVLACVNAAAQIVISSFGTPHLEDFDSLASTGTSGTLPTGWFFSESGANANTLYTGGSGSSTTGDTYSFGATASADRALGGLQSGTLIPSFGAQFLNGTGSEIGGLEVTYTGEQWRLGATGRTDRIDFQYSLDATSLTTGTWLDVDALDFSSPSTTTAGALDGNAAANRTLISQTIGGLNIADNSTFWIRWTDFNPSGSDDGLGVDLTRFVAVPVPEPAAFAAATAIALLGFAAVRRSAVKRS